MPGIKAGIPIMVAGIAEYHPFAGPNRFMLGVHRNRFVHRIPVRLVEEKKESGIVGASGRAIGRCFLTSFSSVGFLVPVPILSVAAGGQDQVSDDEPVHGLAVEHEVYDICRLQIQTMPKYYTYKRTKNWFLPTYGLIYSLN